MIIPKYKKRLANHPSHNLVFNFGNNHRRIDVKEQTVFCTQLFRPAKIKLRHLMTNTIVRLLLDNQPELLASA